MKKLLSLVLIFIMTLSFCNFQIYATDFDDSLVLYYPFEDGSNAQVGSAANSYNVSFSPDGIIGKAVFLDGNSSYLELPKDTNKALKDDFTISTWAKFDSINWWMRIFDFGSGDKNYAFLGLSTPNDLRYALLSNNTPSELTLTAIGTVFENTWLHFTLVRRGETMSLYINGKLCSQSDAFGKNTPSDIENSFNYIGKSQFQSDPYFNGHIDEFKIFTKALSQDEIIINMTKGIKSDYAKMLADTASLYENMTVKKDLYLPTYSSDVTSIYWESSDESIISPTGAVVRADVDKTITLTAFVTTNGTESAFSYNVFVPAESNVNAEIFADVNKKGVDINPNMIGLFFEDINYAADGGLYAELVQNRSFENVNAQWDANPKPIPNHAWTISSSYSFSSENPLNENNTTYLKFTDFPNATTFSNVCYEGFPAKIGEKFDFSIFVRANGNYTGKIMATIKEGDKIIGRAFLEDFSDTWTKYEKEITAVSDASNAILEITLIDSFNGSLDIDMVSLFPQNTWMNRKNGLRADLVQMLKDLHPGFLRFPGGCVIEGYNLSNRYSWKDTVGPVEERKENWNRWQLHTGGDGRYAYCQSYGLGFYEYFLLCEDIGAFPLPVVNVGIGCQYQTGDVSSMEDLYSVYIQDALDLIEFANGATDTKWGALRAEMGHPEPFNLEYIGIGNEQWETNNVNFFERYEAFEEEIHKLYPDIKLIATSGPDASGSKFDAAWNFLNSHSDNGEDNFAYAVDEHYYRTPDWFYTNLDRYDGYSRTGYKVFAGEYASRYSQSKSESNMTSALSVAAYMTSLEKNADIVALASYAPLFARDGFTQWYPDLIGFNNATVYGAPDYYVQSMYSNNLGTYTIENKTINHSNSFTPSGKTGISTWATTAQFYDLKITDNITGEEIDLGTPTATGSNTWYISDNSYTQEDVTAQAPSLLFGTEDMENYTFTLKAKKLAGAEGFLFPVMWKDEQNYFTCNIGGWNNTYSAIQRTENGYTYEYSVQNTSTYIETNREYEIKITVEPHKLAVYLDGKLVNFASFKQNVYSTSSFDEKTGDIIIKAVNPTDSEMETRFNITSDYINPIAHVTELKTTDPSAVNSADNPKNTAPEYFTINASNNFTYNLPPYSFTVFRLHTKPSKDVIVSSDKEYIEIEKNGELSLPDSVTVNYLDVTSGTKEVIWDNIPQEFTASKGTKIIEGKIPDSSVHAYAEVKIVSTDKALLADANISLDGEYADYDLVFTDGVDGNFHFTAVAAAYSENGELLKVKTLPLTMMEPYVQIHLADFLQEHSVKLFLFDNMTPLTEALKVK